MKSPQRGTERDRGWGCCSAKVVNGAQGWGREQAAHPGGTGVGDGEAAPRSCVPPGICVWGKGRGRQDACCGLRALPCTLSQKLHTGHVSSAYPAAVVVVNCASHHWIGTGHAASTWLPGQRHQGREPQARSGQPASALAKKLVTGALLVIL